MLTTDFFFTQVTTRTVKVIDTQSFIQLYTNFACTLTLQGPPEPFPIPMFKEEVEKSLSKKKPCNEDRKYMVRVLATVLLTYVQKPSMRHCEIVAKALLRKFPFLQEYVSTRTNKLLKPITSYEVDAAFWLK